MNASTGLGELLVSKGIISPDQLSSALMEQKKTDKSLRKVVVELGYVNETKLIMKLAEHFAIPYVDLHHFKINQDIIKKIPEFQARRYRCIALQEFETSYLVGMPDPFDLVVNDAIVKILGKKVRPAFVKESDVIEVLDSNYRKSEEIASLALEVESTLEDTADFDLSDIEAENEAAAPVVRLMRSILEDAVQIKASDVHIEPDESSLRVRLRIDGELQEQIMNEKRVSVALVSRLKIMSGLDISEKRLPQDGRFNIKVLGQNIDVRISTMPITHGESVVMRLLDQSAGLLSLDALGMEDKFKKKFSELISRPHGMILVTGPTGSGKTTTLYAALNELNSPERKIITVEDPVEYRLPRICQVQVNNTIDLTFSKVLRTALRQDPDVILVGEMRDKETAEIGTRAALTGHLVLSTLHTNDAIATTMRLIDMNIDPSVIASSLNAVVAQRLIRKVCESCKEHYVPTAQEKQWLESIKVGASKQAYHKGTGCHRCNNTGYHGRTGVYEILVFNEAMINALRLGDINGFEKEALKHEDYESIVSVSLKHAIAGTTSIHEVLKIASTLD